MEITFKGTHTPKDIIISLLVIAAGAGLFLIEGWGQGLGALLVATGLLMLIFWKGAWKKDGQGVALEKECLDLSKKCEASVLDYINGKAEDLNVAPGTDGGSIRVELHYNSKEEIAYAMVYDFESYSYRAVTDTIEIKGQKAKKFLTKLKLA